ncbi:MAG TPA: hypothetical protein VGN68_14485 [Sphingopyxis sp.]|jgi:hypothetical protein|uniref:hypothetical protein n=1 Tax=Sphingopyxis sp. TaxID=1908224 RepID=UPI002E0D6DE0|nr:hypothetical protein [Sphingopyxis sp.]
MTHRNFRYSNSATRWPRLALILALSGAAPVQAQDTETPTPAPSSIFRLPPADEGRAPGVQGPSDNGLPPVAPNERRGVQPPTPTPTPTPTPPRVTSTQPLPTATPTPAPARREAPTTAAPRPASAATEAAPDPAAPSGPALSAQESAPPALAAPVAAPAPDRDIAPPAIPSTDAPAGTPLWAWALAVLAALGAGLWYWRRRPALTGPADDAARAPPRPPASPPAPRAATPPAPRNGPAPGPAPTPALPVAAPRAGSPLVTRAAGEQRARIGMALDIRSIRFAADHVAVGFTLHLQNQGMLPATGLMIRLALGQGSAMPEAVLGRFFDGAGGSVLRDDMELGVGAGDALSTEVMLPRTAIEPLMIGGKPMLVPVMALDVTYHWDGEGEAFGQNAGSFVLGRQQGTGPHDKLAPLPLDRAVYQVDRPGARATAIQRTQ